MNLSKNKIIYALVFGLLFGFSVNAQKPAPAPTPADNQKKKEEAEPSFVKLKVNLSQPLPVKLNAKNVAAQAVVDELKKYYKISFALSPVVAKHKVTFDLPPSTLEAVLKQLAPFVLLEKEIRGGENEPEIKAVFLYAYNEQMPKMTDAAYVLPKQQTLIFEGDTEEGTEDYEKRMKENEDFLPLVVKYANEKITIHSRGERAVAVGGKIAEQLGIPFTFAGGDMDEAVRVDVNQMNPEQAFFFLPPTFKLRYRVFSGDSHLEFMNVVMDSATKEN